jgi:hypothetical protein
MNWGSTRASVGSMMPARISAITTFLPRNSRWLKAKAIIEQTTTVKITASVEIRKLLRYHQPIGLAFHALV